MAEIELRDLTVIYEDGSRLTLAVDRVDLEVKDGELMVLLGPSGCGKSTTLRCVAGLEYPTEGDVVIGGRVVTNLPPKERDVAMVFQNYALYPHLTVAENIAFGLRLRQVPRRERRRKAEEAAEVLGIAGYLDRKPRQLSGGQRQRVAMGRAMVREPQVFLMDEPLSNLDAKLRVEMRAQVVLLQRRLATTMLYVTHDQVEAMTMGDRVAVLRDGRLQQVASPDEVYRRPANVFVAGFIGSPAMNLGSAQVLDETLLWGDIRIPVPRPSVLAGRERVIVGIRPEDLKIARGERSRPRFEVTPVLVEPLGPQVDVHFQPGPERPMFVVRLPAEERPAPGEPLPLEVDPDRIHLFDPETERALE